MCKLGRRMRRQVSRTPFTNKHVSHPTHLAFVLSVGAEQVNDVQDEVEVNGFGAVDGQQALHLMRPDVCDDRHENGLHLPKFKCSKEAMEPLVVVVKGMVMRSPIDL